MQYKTRQIGGVVGTVKKVTYEDKINSMIDRVKAACDKYGVEMQYEWGLIYLKTKYELFHFEPTMGKIKLLHHNTYRTKCEYHLQFEKNIEVEDLVAYVAKHTEAKYMPSKNRKSKQYKKAQQ